ncbi:hypothetical protein I6I72_10095 [Corynebacterium striatum]|uniref:Major capsid protein n=2 Tax=Corynebacterium TaxID=1716 RepID=A0ABX7DCQ2_CORST|nr:hypothetical protein [Corynebacterium striatum]QQU76451.1 hypothetical protein I6I72_10095 [Corynebacterium striatum]
MNLKAAAPVTRFINPDFLTAAADTMTAPGTDSRTLTGLVLPFGKPGRTSAGRLTVDANAVTLPDDIGRVKLYRDHSDQGGTPVGRAVAAEVRDDGLFMSFRIGATPDGDAAITDIVEGIRDALSVELVDAQHAGGKLTAAQLTAVAIVPVPAFDDARVTGASFAKRDEDEQETPPSDPEAPVEDDDQDKEDEDEKKKKTTAAARRNTLTTRLAATSLTAATPRKETMKLTTVSEIIASKINGTDTVNGVTVTAALAEVTQAAQPAVQNEEWLGELFAAAPFERLIVPTMKQRSLTRMKLRGWRWKETPKVDDYAGNLQEIPTNEITTEPVEVDAQRIAGGHKIDRKFIDFADSEFIESYLREMANSYKEKTDVHAVEFIVTEGDKVAEAGSQPTLLHAAAKANQIIKKKLRKDATTFLVNTDDMFKLFDITLMDQPQYLALFNIDPAKFIADDAVPAGHVVAYHRDSLAFGELPGSPIRVDALDIAHGGSDNALFGYWAALLEDPRGLTTVPFGAKADAGA